MQKQQIELNGDIGIDVTLANIMGAVKLYPDSEVEFIVKSWGGYVDEAWRIYNYLETVSNVSVIFKDVCCSATTFAFLSLPVDKRKAYQNTQFAIHLPFNSYMFEDMNIESLETDTARLRQITDEINACYEKHLNLTKEEILNLISPDSFFNETAAQGFQIISEVLENPNQNENGNWMFDLVFAKSRIAAFYPKNNNNQTKNEMSELNQIKEEMTGFKALLTKVVNFVFPAKAMKVSTEEGSVIELDGDILEVNTKILSETLDGTYTVMYMEKKYTITVANKTVTEMVEIVDEPADDEMDALKAENEALKQQLEAAQAKTTEVANELETAKASQSELETLRTDFANAKAMLEKVQTKVFNPDNAEESFTPSFDDVNKPKATIDKETMAKKVKEIKDTFKKNK